MGIPRGASALVGVELALGVAVAVVSSPALQGGYVRDRERWAGTPSGGLLAASTSRERLRKLPIARRDGGKSRTVLSLRLPRIALGDRIRLNGEVTLSTTCVDPPGPDCIGRGYRFDPHLHARVVLASHRGETGRGTLPVSRRASVTCEKTEPNINHHCPLVITRGSFLVRRPGELPCRPRACRLNMVVDAHSGRARGGEVVVVGSAKQDGIGGGDGARLNAALAREGARVRSVVRSTGRRRTRKLPASFEGGRRVVYSQRMERLRAGDVLLVRARQRTAIKRHRYYIGSRVVIATRPRARRPGRLTRRIVSPNGAATGSNGFNCTLGPSGFRTPCLRKKAGLAFIERTPRRARGQIRPLYVNLVSRSFPKVGNVPGSYPSARVLSGSRLAVTRLRAERLNPGEPPLPSREWARD